MDSHNIVEKVILELKEIQDYPEDNYKKDGIPTFPQFLSTEDGRQIFISQNINQLITNFAHQNFKGNDNLKSHFTWEDYRRIVRGAFGQALSKIDLDNSLNLNITAVLIELEKITSEEIESILSTSHHEYTFGCMLFTNTEFPPFEIGPVQFEPKLAWLDRKSTDGRWIRIGEDGFIRKFKNKVGHGPISKITKRRIIRAWQGHKLKERKSSKDKFDEESILDTIGDCPYVCSVKVNRHSSDSGKNKALTSAHMALATIALIVNQPSKAMAAFMLNYGRENRSKSHIVFTPDGLLCSSWSRIYPPYGCEASLTQILREYPEVLYIPGEAINYYIDPSSSNRPSLMNTMAHTLLLLHDGFREKSHLISIVKLSAALEILSGGKGRKNIKKLIKARLNINEDQRFLIDGSTLNDVIDQIYDKGRNRMIHGDNKGLTHDWSSTRNIAEQLARDCFLSCIRLVHENPTSDNPKLFLK